MNLQIIQKIFRALEAFDSAYQLCLEAESKLAEAKLDSAAVDTSSFELGVAAVESARAYYKEAKVSFHFYLTFAEHERSISPELSALIKTSPSLTYEP